MYKNPLKLIKKYVPQGSNFNDPQTIIKVKKQLLTEFSLLNTVEIEIDGNLYTKDEILKTLENISTSSEHEAHGIVLENETLLSFLETPENFDINILDIATIKQLLSLENSHSEFFQRWISNAFLERFKELFRKFDFSYATATVIIANNIFDNELSEEITFKINTTLDNIVNYIDSQNGIYTYNMNQYINKDIVSFLNELPEDYQNYKDSYAVACINYAVSLQKKNCEQAALFNGFLLKLNSIDEYTTIIKDNQKIYSQEKSSGLKWYHYVMFIVFIFKFIRLCV